MKTSSHKEYEFAPRLEEMKKSSAMVMHGQISCPRKEISSLVLSMANSTEFSNELGFADIAHKKRRGKHILWYRDPIAGRFVILEIQEVGEFTLWVYLQEGDAKAIAHQYNPYWKIRPTLMGEKMPSKLAIVFERYCYMSIACQTYAKELLSKLSTIAAVHSREGKRKRVFVREIVLPNLQAEIDRELIIFRQNV